MQEAHALHMFSFGPDGCYLLSNFNSSTVVIGHLNADIFLCVKNQESICLGSGKKRAEETRAPKAYRLHVTRNSDDNINSFFSCMPTATTQVCMLNPSIVFGADYQQVFMTQVYSGTGEAEHLGAFLIPQYALMFVSMTALTAYTLHLLF